MQVRAGPQGPALLLLWQNPKADPNYWTPDAGYVYRHEGLETEIRPGARELQVSLGKGLVTQKYKVHPKRFHGTARAADHVF